MTQKEYVKRRLTDIIPVPEVKGALNLSEWVKCTGVEGLETDGEITLSVFEEQICVLFRMWGTETAVSLYTDNAWSRLLKVTETWFSCLRKQTLRFSGAFYLLLRLANKYGVRGNLSEIEYKGEE